MVNLEWQRGKITAHLGVRAEAERVWQVLTAFEQMPARLSGLKKSRVLAREDSRYLVEQKSRVRVPLLNISFGVLLEIEEDKPFLHFRQKHGSFASFSGVWEVRPNSNGKGSIIYYKLNVQMRRHPASWFEKLYLGKIIRQNLEELAVWIEEEGAL
ncbi:MAG: SRPBCC family protein [Deltaproteobacteria bacterium]|nr:SRPBCC family protein [Deltaproteobacteria bacterium]